MKQPLRLAQSASTDEQLFAPAATLDATIAKLCALPGVGEWTAQYIALVARSAAV